MVVIAEGSYKVRAYDTFHGTHEWTVESLQKAREYASRIITEGLWYADGDEEVFLPVQQVFKVKIFPA